MELESQIKSHRISLRNLTVQDATPAYLNWLSNPEINRFLEVRFNPPKTLADLGSGIMETNKSDHTLMLGIFLNTGGSHIGNIKLGPIDFRHSVGDIGFLIGDSNQWGKGYASEAIALFSDYAFTKLGLAKLTAGSYAENEGSRRALIKAGFHEEGRRKSQWLVGDVRQDGILLGRVGE